MSRKKTIKIMIISLCSLLLFVALILVFIWLQQPVCLDYDECIEYITVEEIDGYLYVFYAHPVQIISYLANDGGTIYLHSTDQNDGRCYRQSIQIETTRWNQLITKKTVLYKRELGAYGAISGESNIINEDGTIRTVPRYDVELFFRDSTGVEHLIWSFDE